MSGLVGLSWLLYIDNNYTLWASHNIWLFLSHTLHLILHPHTCTTEMLLIKSTPSPGLASTLVWETWLPWQRDYCKPTAGEMTGVSIYSISSSSMCDDLYLLSFCIHCGSRYQTIDILGQHHVSLQGCRVLIRGISSWIWGSFLPFLALYIYNHLILIVCRLLGASPGVWDREAAE